MWLYLMYISVGNHIENNFFLEGSISFLETTRIQTRTGNFDEWNLNTRFPESLPTYRGFPHMISAFQMFASHQWGEVIRLRALCRIRQPLLGGFTSMGLRFLRCQFLQLGTMVGVKWWKKFGLTGASKVCFSQWQHRPGYTMMVSHSCMYMICIQTCNMYTHIFYIHIYIHPWLSVCFYATYPPFTGHQNPTMGWLAMVGGLLQVTQTQVQNTNEFKSHPNTVYS